MTGGRFWLRLQLLGFHLIFTFQMCSPSFSVTPSRSREASGHKCPDRIPGSQHPPRKQFTTTELLCCAFHLLSRGSLCDKVDASKLHPVLEPRSQHLAQGLCCCHSGRLTTPKEMWGRPTSNCFKDPLDCNRPITPFPENLLRAKTRLEGLLPF